MKNRKQCNQMILAQLRDAVERVADVLESRVCVRFDDLLFLDAYNAAGDNVVKDSVVCVCKRALCGKKLGNYTEIEVFPAADNAGPGRVKIAVLMPDGTQIAYAYADDFTTRPTWRVGTIADAVDEAYSREAEEREKAAYTEYRE